MVALVLLRVLLRAGNKRNVPLVGLLGLMALANGVFHLSVLEVLALSALSALYAQDLTRPPPLPPAARRR